MSNLVIFDTSIFVDYLRAGGHTEKIEQVAGIIRSSSVVLAELWRGASSAREHKFLKELERNHPVLSPTARNWIESGQLLGKIYTDKGFTPAKLRDLHFDVLIALTARSHGARIVTSNRVDFEMISSYRKIHLEIW